MISLRILDLQTKVSETGRVRRHRNLLPQVHSFPSLDLVAYDAPRRSTPPMIDEGGLEDVRVLVSRGETHVGVVSLRLSTREGLSDMEGI